MPAIWVATRIPSVPCKSGMGGFFLYVYAQGRPREEAANNVFFKEGYYVRFKICKGKSRDSEAEYQK